MPAIIIFLIIFGIVGDRNNKFTRKTFSLLKKIIIGCILVSALGWVIPVVAILAGVIFPGFLLLGFIIWMLIRTFNKNAARKNQGSLNQRNDDTGRYYGADNYRGTSGKFASSLPKAASARRRIIEKFNKKYELLLTDSQIQRIVDASYYSPQWDREIQDMNQEYNSIYEWFQGDTAWLRAYLKAFRVQSISSDFKQQHDICVDEYNQVFSGVDMTRAFNQDAAITEINNTYFTQFNDISFMIAYRFLEANGKRYNLSQHEVVRNESETDRLARKYEDLPDPDLSGLRAQKK